VARVSKTPGRTQQINFFLVSDRWYLVDLPGYGFARVPLAVRAQWRHLVEGYLACRATLRGVVVIVDVRRGVQADDAQLLDFLQSKGIRVCIALTKIDKIARGQRRQLIDAVRQGRPDVEAIVCSAVTGEGVADVGRVLRQWLDAS
jgi:GTP-binding protein